MSTWRPLVSLSPAMGLQILAVTTVFSTQVLGDQNSDPHACAASTILMEPPPQPMSILSEVLLQLIERSGTPAQPLSTERAGESQTSPRRSPMKWHKSFTGSDLGCLTQTRGVLVCAVCLTEMHCLLKIIIIFLLVLGVEECA